MQRIKIITAILTFVIGNSAIAHEEVIKKKRTKSPEVEEVMVWGAARDSSQSGYTNPTSVLTQEDMVSINATTTEDLVKYEPSLVIRKRYIGDSNGTLGLRGSNMFATPRSMVFADGVPLHYFLQTRWSGAPRWTMVSASEIAQVEILYGPFSAEYSGNSMGGVILIETAIPQKREVHIDMDYFSQDANAYGFKKRLDGYKTFISYGDKLDDFSFYVSYNHLENDSQPQSFYYDARIPTGSEIPVTGAVDDQDIFGNRALYFGDTGIEQATTDNLKLKLGYEWERWSTLLNIAYEDRNTLRDSPNTYLRDSNGNKIWAGNFVQDGMGMNVGASRLGASELDRQSLSIGLRVKGELNDSTTFEANISDFSILKDNNRASSRSLEDPLFNGTGQTTDYDDTGWQTFEGKLVFEDLGVDGLEVVTGIRHEAYQLHIDQYNSLDWSRGDNNGYTGRSGGETSISAVFAQMNWNINEQWDLALGGRYEQWDSKSGYYTAKNAPDVLVPVDDRSQNQFSPKFSLGYIPVEDWLVRYSLARAYRFPIVEELFSKVSGYSSEIEANADLKPENGLHHNLMFEKQYDTGYVRVNLYKETIKDAIESQTILLVPGDDKPASYTNFLSIDEVETDGVELVLNRYGFLIPELDIRFNLAYTKSIIADNSSAESLGDPDADSVEGNAYPRMPRWRGNLMMTYHINDHWDISANAQYADKSFGRSDNTDIAENVMGAQDGYTLYGLKTTYGLSETLKLGLGIDNITDELNFVAHPWPRRTLFLSLSYAM